MAAISRLRADIAGASAEDESDLAVWLRLSTPVSVQSVSAWLHQLSMLQQSGVDLARAASVLGDQEPNPRLRRITQQVFAMVLGQGAPLSKAFAFYPKVFPAEVRMLVEAGEIGGDLAGCLAKAASLLEYQSQLRHRVRAALAPPLATLGLCLVLGIVVVQTIMPRFLLVFRSLRVTPTPITRAVVLLVHALTSPWFWALALALGVYAVLYGDVLKQALYPKLLTWPTTSHVAGQLLAIPFADITARLYEGGIPLLKILDMLSTSQSVQYHARHMAELRDEFKAGTPLSKSLLLIPYFPPMLRHLVAVGEEAGALPAVLRASVTMLDEQTQDLLHRVVTLLEPLALAGAGVMATFFMVGVMLPLYQLMQAIH